MRYFVGLFLVAMVIAGLLGYSFLIGNSKPKVLSLKNVQSVYPREVQDTTIIFGGDVMMGRSVRNTVNDLQDYAYPFVNLINYLSSADIVFVNLENPFVENCPFHDSGYKFCSDPESVSTLKHGSIDIVSIANNHTGNYGKLGFESTKNILIDNGINYTGGNNLVVKEVNGTKFGFLGFDFTFKKPTNADFKLVSNSDNLADVLIVAPHWGVEYKAQPEEYQRDWAKLFVQNGADLIIGSHPHWVQGVDCVNGLSWQYFDREIVAEKLRESNCEKFVFYSLGNFVFDQMWSEETKKGLLVEMNFVEGNIKNIIMKNIYIGKIGQPQLLNN